jgi:hypothetical protein
MCCAGSQRALSNAYESFGAGWQTARKHHYPK